MKTVHDKIQESLAKEYLSKDYEVYVESTIKCGNKNYRCDLLLIKDNKRKIIEIGHISPKKLQDYLKYKVDFINVPFVFIKDGLYEHICGYKWVPKVPKPKQCPQCKRYL